MHYFFQYNIRYLYLMKIVDKLKKTRKIRYNSISKMKRGNKNVNS